MNPELQSILAKILGAMQQGLTEYGPKALEMALEVQRWGCTGRVAAGLILLAFTIWGIPRALKTFWKEMEKFDEMRKTLANRYDTPTPVIPVLWAVGSVIVLTLTSINALIYLLNIWNWVGIFRPDITFAYGLMQRVLNQ